MQKQYHSITKTFIIIAGLIFFLVGISKAQSVYLPYSYQFDQKFNSSIYSINNSFHSSLKPYLIDSILQPRYNQLMNLGVDSTRKGWIRRKLFNEHLFNVKNKDYTFYGDYLTDFQFGRDILYKLNTNVNTRGYQFGGTVGNKFFFYTSGYENQGKFPLYYREEVDKITFVPGQAYDHHPLSASKDWSYITAIISYTPIKQLNITLGEDKTFIGDGYRSLLLSDFAANYPLLRITTNLGKVQYMMMWAYLQDQKAKQFNAFSNNRRKWAAFHYLDWNVTNRLSLGYFNAFIAEEANDAGVFHPFSVNYINPLFFSASKGLSYLQDNVLTGFTAKYKIFDKTAIYGQLLLDRFKLSDFSSSMNTDNTNGVQIGIRGADLFKVKNLNYLAEFNKVKPYTYSSQQPITSFTEYNEPLADPLGANFKEYLGILNYSLGRFDFMGQLMYAKRGLDLTNSNNGGNVNKPFPTDPATPTITGQGIATNLTYAEGTVSYLINPKYNLRFELGGIYRNETNILGSKKTHFVTFGLRSTFRDLYHDF